MLGGLLAAALQAASAEGGSEDRFAAAVHAYRAGDYPAARRGFEEALAADPGDERLRFNLALTLYRLGDDEGARLQFERLCDSVDLGAAAEYHLGLVAARRDLSEQAVEHLQRARSKSRDGPMRQLVDLALQRLSEETRRSASRIAGGLGFDGNRIQSSEKERRADHAKTEAAFAQLAASFERPIDAAGARQLGASLYLRDDAGDSRYDQQALQLSLRLARAEQAGWRFAGTGETAAVRLDDALFQQVLGFELEAQGRWGSADLLLRYRPRRIFGGPDYAYLDGWSQRLEAIYVPLDGTTRLRFSTILDLEDRRDLRRGEEFFSQSPLRVGLGLSAARALGPRLQLEGSVQHRYSRYRDEHRLVLGTQLIERRRIDRQLQLGAAAQLRLDARWSLRLDGRYSHNPSTLERYDYERQWVLLSFEWTP